MRDSICSVLSFQAETLEEVLDDSICLGEGGGNNKGDPISRVSQVDNSTENERKLNSF